LMLGGSADIGLHTPARERRPCSYFLGSIVWEFTSVKLPQDSIQDSTALSLSPKWDFKKLLQNNILPLDLPFESLYSKKYKYSYLLIMNTQ
jgi:hypothetical protein